MFSFQLISVSATTSGPYRELQAEYAKRLQPFAKLARLDVPHVAFSSTAERERVQVKEAERLRKSIFTGSLVVALDETGKHFTSEQFAQQLLKWSEQETRTISFVLGGPLGLDPQLKKEAHAILSLSTLTFPHDLAQVVLLEQLYRALTILRKKTYHY